MNDRGPATPAPARAARHRFAVATCAVAISAALTALLMIPAARAAEPPEGVLVELMPLQAVRPGMEGTARTVFEGERLEEFRVEILGVLRNAVGPEQDLILGRLRGDKVEFTGVVAGMSGSPVYIDGKLVGALSYRIGQFAKEAIAGITPIADMMRLGSGGGVGHARAADPLGRFLG
ncbi:MAG: SpoIVB peptidase S55 domain-containing protein, partial [Candidatus Polarisedimenticolia bacterium]